MFGVCVCVLGKGGEGSCARSKRPPCLDSKRARVHRLHAHTCVSTCARGACTHGGVLHPDTEGFRIYTRGFFSVSNTIQHHNNTQHNTTRNITRRQGETEKEDRERETRQDRRRQDKTKEKKTRQENRRQEKRRETREDERDDESIKRK